MLRRSFLQRLAALFVAPALPAVPELPAAELPPLYTYHTYATGFGLTTLDQQRLTAQLMRSMLETQETIAANIFNCAFQQPEEA